MSTFLVHINCIKIITLIDDIYTTGSTIDAMVKCLKDSGIQKVHFTTIAMVDNL